MPTYAGGGCGAAAANVDRAEAEAEANEDNAAAEAEAGRWRGDDGVSTGYDAEAASGSVVGAAPIIVERDTVMAEVRAARAMEVARPVPAGAQCSRANWSEIIVAAV